MQCQPLSSTLMANAALFASRLRETADHGKTLIDLVTPMPPGSPGIGGSTPLPDAGQTVQISLQPVTGSARRAVDLFMREVPGMPPEKQ